MKYSVVMAVYRNDEPEWLSQAVESLLRQTLPSDDIVIVIDGPLAPELDRTIQNYSNNDAINVVRLKENLGLGNALNVGIKKAKHELIGRMDSDDISVENRFEHQVDYFKKHPSLGILGGQAAEFTDTPENITTHRIVPISHVDIQHFARRRSPFNHPSVMYKKATIQDLGGYDASVIRIEDYDLWLRALANGVRCANLNTNLIYYRSSSQAMKRRKTVTSLKNHVKARLRFHRNGYISLLDLAYGISTQTLLFILPLEIADKVFRKAVRG